jgi:hypothetical protein
MIPVKGVLLKEDLLLLNKAKLRNQENFLVLKISLAINNLIKIEMILLLLRIVIFSRLKVRDNNIPIKIIGSLAKQDGGGESIFGLMNM